MEFQDASIFRTFFVLASFSRVKIDEVEVTESTTSNTIYRGRKNRHIISRLFLQQSIRQPNIDFASSSPRERFLRFLKIVHNRNKNEQIPYACMRCMRCAPRQRAAARFLYANFAKVTQSAKITVGNNAIDWCRTSLARALRETDNISLGRPLRRTIK